MVTNFLIALAIAVAIVFIWGWLGDWSQTRHRRESAEYWASHELQCPNCDVPYPRDAATREWSTFRGESNTGWSFACPDCGEQAAFRRADPEPEFEDYWDQPRRCLECSELFTGGPASACPICSTVHRVLAHNTAHPQGPLRGTPSV